ncbi:MAG: NTF2-like N-terminal transpeptidase domain-containing protein, partial [Thermocrispum sp.]
MEKDRRLAIGIIVATVLAFAGAGALVLRSELSADDETRMPGAWEVAWEYLAAFDEGKVGDAAALTVDPAAARKTLQRINRKLPDASVSTALGEVKTTGGTASGSADLRWTFEDGRTFSYRTKIPLVRRDGTWRVDFSPAVVHPELDEGQHIAVVSRDDVPAVTDAAGKPLLIWGEVGPRPVRESRAKVLLPAMLTRAQKRKPPERWAVAAMNTKNKRVKILEGSGPKGAKPLRTTLSIPVQDAAQAAVDGQGKPAALVAFTPSTGAVLAVAQNKHADQGPIALSGLYPPGSTFSLVTEAAEGES